MYSNKSNSEIPHQWAHQLKPSGKASNIFFEGATIYSYGRHFPIATLYENIVLFTLDSYSRTTSRHINSVQQAISHKTIVYCLNPESAARGNHHDNIQYWINGIKRNFDAIKSARKISKYTDEISYKANQLNTYMQLFKLRQSYLSKEDKQMIKQATSEDVKALALVSAKKAEKAKVIKEKKAKIAYEFSVKFWKDNNSLAEIPDKTKTLGSWYESKNYQTLPTYLRVYDGNIETSKGIKIPLPIARRFYKQYLAKIEAGGCIENCGDWQILNYNVNTATSEQLIIGCHKIERAEIQRIANILNW